MTISTVRQLAILLAVFVSSWPCLAQDDVAHIKSEKRQIDGDKRQSYFLIGPHEDALPPEEGYGLIVVLPGGDGSAEFNAFVKRIYDNAAPERYLLAQLVAPQWSPKQEITWPTKKNRVPRMKFTTEEFVDKVIADVEREHKLNPGRIFLFGWSSGGPAVYSVALANPRVSGVLAAMAIFKPELLPPLEGAKKQAIYIYHCDDDRVVPVRFADAAAVELSKAGADVKMTKYEGGHGWHGDIFGDIHAAIEWLEAHARKQ